MPANLNALIRYKTIDMCLSNRYRKWTIKDLMVACSEALREHRGVNTGVSERTLRDDIRVMRSNILGFNAPIKQRAGKYFYSDSSYTIFQVSTVKKKLLKRILVLLLEIRAEMDHPELEILIEKLAEIIPVDDKGARPEAGLHEAVEEAPGELSEEDILRDEAAPPSGLMYLTPSAAESHKAKRKISIPSLKKEEEIKYTFFWKNVLDLI